MNEPEKIHIERLESTEALKNLEGEWQTVMNAAQNAPVFLSWEWVVAWWENFGQGRHLWLLTARTSNGGLIGIAPLMLEIQHKGPFKIRVVKFIGAGVTYAVHLDLLAVPDRSRETAFAICKYLNEHSQEWDILCLTALDAASPLPEVLKASEGYLCSGRQSISAYIPLPQDWESYQKTLAKKLRRNLKYFRSRLEGDHPDEVDFSPVTNPDELSQAMDMLETLNKNRWHERERVSNFDSPNFARFHQAVARSALRNGWLRLNRLRVNGQTIAACYNLLFHQRMYAYAIGFDTSWKGYSPGRLAIAGSIQAAIGDAAIEYDWLEGEETYKFAWTDQRRVEEEVLFAQRWYGKLWISGTAFLQAARLRLVIQARKWIPQSLRDRVNQLLAPHYTQKEAQDEDNPQ